MCRLISSESQLTACYPNPLIIDFVSATIGLTMWSLTLWSGVTAGSDLVARTQVCQSKGPGFNVRSGQIAYVHGVVNTRDW